MLIKDKVNCKLYNLIFNSSIQVDMYNSFVVSVVTEASYVMYQSLDVSISELGIHF